MKHKSVYRTAPATMGLLNISWYLYKYTFKAKALSQEKEKNKLSFEIV